METTLHIVNIWLKAQSRQSARLFLLSSGLGRPPPHPQVSVSPLLCFRGGGAGGHSRLREMGWGRGPNSDEGADTPVLYVLYKVYLHNENKRIRRMREIKHKRNRNGRGMKVLRRRGRRRMKISIIGKGGE
jgi:hypothetical protein